MVYKFNFPVYDLDNTFANFQTTKTFICLNEILDLPDAR